MGPERGAVQEGNLFLTSLLLFHYTLKWWKKIRAEGWWVGIGCFCFLWLDIFFEKLLKTKVFPKHLISAVPHVANHNPGLIFHAEVATFQQHCWSGLVLLLSVFSGQPFQRCYGVRCRI
jgi:hypothetical protein